MQHAATNPAFDASQHPSPKRNHITHHVSHTPLTKFLTLFLLLILGASNVWGQSYTISFKSQASGTSDGSTKRTTTADIISSGSDYMTVTNASNIYNGKPNYGIKGGTGSAQGSITLTTTTLGKVKPSKITINACYYGSDAKDLNVSVNEGTNKTLDLTNEFKDFEISLDGTTDLSTLKIEASTASNARFYIKSVTITYSTKTLSSLTVSGNPTKTTYQAGEALDPTGLTVTGKYSDNSEETITKDIEWTLDPETLSAGATTCDVMASVGQITSDVYTVKGLTVTAAKTLQSIAVSGTYQTEFWKGDTFNHDGVVVTATWDDESKTDVTSESTFSTPDMTTPGEKTVTVTYKGEETSYNINVKTIANTAETSYTTAEAIALIDAGKDLTTKVYVKGVISAIVEEWSTQYSNITYDISDDGQTTSQQFRLYRCKTNGAAVGDLVVAEGTMTLYNSTYEFKQGNTISSKTSPQITAIAVSGTPTKTVYEDGDSFNPAGLVVTGTYNFGDPKEITEGIEWTFNPTTLTAGTTSCSVTAKVGEIASPAYNVTGLTVNATRTLTSVVVSGTPTKNVYEVGECFDPAGLTVTANYNIGDPVDVSNEAEFYGIDEPLTLGTTSFETFATYNSVDSEIMTYDITVNKKTSTITIADITLEATKTATISATTTPANAELTYTITEGSDVISIEDNVITGLKEGEATVKAEYQGNENYSPAEKTFTVTVTPFIPKHYIDLSIDETTTANANKLEWSSLNVTTTIDKAKATTDANNYYPGTTGQSYKATRLYKNSTLTFTPAKGVTLGTITFTASTEGYATALKESTWTNATASASGTIVTITPTDGTKTAVATIGATTGGTAIEIIYSGTATPALSKIELSGNYPTEFTQGDEFSHEGMIVTATYTDNSTKDVTTDAVFTEYNMSKAGEQTVNVSYTEDEVTKSATYTINVARKLSPATDGYETVDFTTIEPYSSLTGTGSAAMVDYQGLSFDMKFSKGTNNNNAPKYYVTGASARAYSGNTITITAAEDIKGVVIAWTKEKGEDKGVQITGIGTKTAVVTFANTCSFASITVWYKEIQVDLAITSAKWSTFIAPFEVKLTDECKAYTAKMEDKKVVFTELTDGTVPAKTPVVIYKDVTGEIYTKQFVGVSEATEDTYTKDALVGVLKATSGISATVEKESVTYQNYVLQNHDNVVGFYRLDAEASLKANRCYLSIPKPEQGDVKSCFAFDDIMTGINSILAPEANAPKGIYDMNGRKLDAPQKGMNIINGVKVYIK